LHSASALLSEVDLSYPVSYQCIKLQFRGAKLRKKECNAKEKPDFLLTLPRRSNFGKAKVTKKACKEQRILED
jgi:hypothetical protein